MFLDLTSHNTSLCKIKTFLKGLRYVNIFQSFKDLNDFSIGVFKEKKY